METIKAKIEAVLIADDPETFVTRSIPEVHLEFGGIPGDRHFGVTRAADVRQPMYPRGTEILNRRQISMISDAECDKIAENLGIPSVLPNWLGANVLLSGISDLTSLPEGSRLLFPSGAGLVCENENLSCVLPGNVIQKHHPDQSQLAPKFVKAAHGQRGIVCSVERPGWIKQGDEIKILINDPSNPMQ